MGTIYRLFSENAEISHLKKFTVEEFEAHKEWFPAKQWRFNVHDVGKVIDWHPSNGKFIVVVLAGKIEIGVSDGTRLVFGPGEMRILTDYGKGHCARVVSDVPAEFLMVELPEDQGETK
jgi:hypothetical protein